MTPLRPFLTTVAGGGTLARADAATAMAVLMRGEASPEEMAGLLVGMAGRGETVDELTGFAETIQSSSDCISITVIDFSPGKGDLSGMTA